MAILNMITQLKKRAKKCMTKEQVSALSDHLRPLVNEAHDAQISDKDLTKHHVQLAQVTLSSIQSEIERAERQTTPERRTTTPSRRATDTDNQTQSGNISKNISDDQENHLLRKFNILYNRMPDLNDGEPIKYIEERHEHDEAVLTKLDRHYHSICDSLKAMQELPINNDVSLPALLSLIHI